jgi:DNA-binding LytR/AlgR family response regulator
LKDEPVFGTLFLEKDFWCIGKTTAMEEQVNEMKKIKSRLIVRKGEENIALKLEEIAFIYRDNAVVFVVDSEQRKYLCNKNLSELETELDGRIFFRVNRKYILNINAIKSFKAIDKVKLEVNLTVPSLQHKIVISQETAPLFKKWIAEEM